jgi:hypothetical protein
VKSTLAESGDDGAIAEKRRRKNSRDNQRQERDSTKLRKRGLQTEVIDRPDDAESNTEDKTKGASAHDDDTTGTKQLQDQVRKKFNDEAFFVIFVVIHRMWGKNRLRR